MTRTLAWTAAPVAAAFSRRNELPHDGSTKSGLPRELHEWQRKRTCKVPMGVSVDGKNRMPASAFSGWTKSLNQTML